LSPERQYLITNKGLTLKSAQQHGQRYMSRLFDYVEQADLDPAQLITHDLPLEEEEKVRA
jgi:threonine dehydrogenase-like Zn-dependent dehydrogenase